MPDLCTDVDPENPLCQVLGKYSLRLDSQPGVLPRFNYVQPKVRSWFEQVARQILPRRGCLRTVRVWLRTTWHLQIAKCSTYKYTFQMPRVFEFMLIGSGRYVYNSRFIQPFTEHRLYLQRWSVTFFFFISWMCLKQMSNAWQDLGKILQFSVMVS